MSNSYDLALITVHAGRGGHGAVSFRRERYVPRGGPDGGTGGSGGNVVIRADPSLTNLLPYSYQRVFHAPAGKGGEGRKKQGRSGEDTVLGVPVGTKVWEVRDGERLLLADIDLPGKEVVVARGGSGGRGNVHFATADNQAPRIAEAGEEGESKTLLLELELPVDIGIIGLPNAGKSSLLTCLSHSKVKAAPYPFTTQAPACGVWDSGKRRVVVAELPALVEGSHLGRGLGHEFLRHARRAKLFLYLLDGASSYPERDLRLLEDELCAFDEALLHKPRLVVVNKIDLPQVRSRKKEVAQRLLERGVRPLFISSVTEEGIPQLLSQIETMLEDTPEDESPQEVTVFRPQPRRLQAEISLEDDVFVIHDPVVEQVVAGSDLENIEVRRQIMNLINRRGIDNLLKKAGAQTGSKVRCGLLEWEW